MTQPADWRADVDETVATLSRLIRADTSNPPGDESPAIQVLKAVFEREGLPADAYTVVESAPRRLSLIARLRGDGTRRPLLLSGHLDVVPVEREHWTRDPFGGEVADGCVWGRGAVDMKGAVAMFLQVFLRARRRSLPLKRDLIFAAIADEEALFTHGSKFLVDQHPDLIDAEYGLTEFGATTVRLGSARLYPIQVAEKAVCWMRMTARGEPGHGSMPHADNAVGHLADAIARLGRAGHLPLHISPTVRRMLEAAGAQTTLPVRLLLSLLRQPAACALAMRVLPPATRTLLTAMVTNSVAPTMLDAGTKVNVIPSTAEAHLDCRLVPGQTPAGAMREILSITGNRVELEPYFTNSGAEFPADTPLYALLVRATRSMDPQGIVVPMLATGATDASEYQRRGIVMYGFTPGVLPQGFPLVKLPHGHDERLPILAIETGLPALWEVVGEFCT